MEMPRDELAANLGQLLAGLAVPVSMEMPLGRAGPAWTALHRGLIGFGWARAEDYEDAIRESLGLPPLTRPAAAAEAAR
jgi:hypothetical protein